MKNLSFIFIITSIFFKTIAMEKTKKESCLYIYPVGSMQPIKIDKTIADQSNLLKILQEKYSGSQKNPISIPRTTITQKEVTFFCASIIKSPTTLIKELSDQEYCDLITITEKLKCPIFYAELIEPLLPPNDLHKRFFLEFINQEKLKQIIYKKCLKKNLIPNKNPIGSHSMSINFSDNGHYFSETFSYKNSYITNLWKTKNFSFIKQFRDTQKITFTPKNNYIFVKNSLFVVNTKKNYSLTYCVTPIRIPIISPDGECFTDGGYIYHIKNYPRFLQYYLPLSCPIFHPNKNLIIYTDKGIFSNIIVCDIHGKNRHQITYNDEERKNDNSLVINHDGTLLLLDNEILLNIENPYKPIIIKRFSPNNGQKAFFIPHKNIFVYYPYSKRSVYSYNFCLINSDGKKLTSDYQYPHKTITSNDGNFLAILSIKNEHYIELWNISHLPSKIFVTKIKPCITINNISFTKDNLLIVESYQLQLWDMDGDNILNLGQKHTYASNPNDGSIITTQNLNTQRYISHNEANDIDGPTKICHYTINVPKAKQFIQETINSLTLSQVLVLNKIFNHKKNKKLFFHPNLPEGRILKLFTNKKLDYLTKGATLHKKDHVQQNS